MKTLITLVLLLPSMAFADAPTIFGKWKTIDDATGKPKSIIEIVKDGDSLKGTIVELIEPDKPNPLCEKCTGDNKDKPVLGMAIMSGFKSSSDGQIWKDGEILDPGNGKVYSCHLHLKEGGKKLAVRGYIGISLLGRTQTWERF